MTNTNKNILKNRLKYIIYGTFLCFIIILLKIGYLVVIGYDRDFSKSSNKEKQALRQDIIDRNGNILAINIPSVSVYIRPQDIKDKNAAIVALREVLSISHDTASNFVNSSSSFLWVKRNISEKEELNLRYHGVIGIYFQKGTKRFYPYGSLFAHSVGITDIDGKGLSGAESYFNKTLYEKTIQLSLDLNMQNILYESLKIAKEKNMAKSAYGMIIDPNTSEVLALVSLPDFDPNDRSEFNLNNLYNYPTQALIEQGSIAKVFSVAMALDNGKHMIRDTYDVSKPIVNSSYVITDHDYIDGYINIPEILMYSSNIGSSILMSEIGIANQIRYLNRFNLFGVTSVEVHEKEKSITLPIWNNLTAMTVSYGYGIAMSQATFINGFSAVINGGQFIPLTIKKIKDKENLTKVRIISEEVSNIMRKILRLTVAKGTGKKADVIGYSVGGKTGSAEKQISGRYHPDIVIASFAAFFPYIKPKYALIVSINEPKRVAHNNYNITGGSLSAPVVSEIISKIAAATSLEKQMDDTILVTKNNKESIINYVESKN